MTDVLKYRWKRKGRLAKECFGVLGGKGLMANLNQDLGVLDRMSKGCKTCSEHQSSPLGFDEWVGLVTRGRDDGSVVAHVGSGSNTPENVKCR